MARRDSNDTLWTLAAILGSAVLLGAVVQKKRHAAALPQEARGATTRADMSGEIARVILHDR